MPDISPSLTNLGEVRHKGFFAYNHCTYIPYVFLRNSIVFLELFKLGPYLRAKWGGLVSGVITQNYEDDWHNEIYITL